MGRPACENRLRTHFAAFITEQDISDIKDAGFNFVRIPFNYWDVTPDLSEPYPAGIGWAFVDQAIRWCAKFGLQVGIGLHALPGGQNPWNHAGRTDFFGWNTDFSAYSQRSTAALVEVVNRIKGPNYAHVRLFELANEPYMAMMSADTTERIRGWYRSVVVTLRSMMANTALYPTGGPELMISESFLGANVFYGQSLRDQGLGTAYVDFHYYSIFEAGQIAQSPAGHISGIPYSLTPNLQSFSTIGPAFLGEFSAAMTDCAQFMNGVYGLHRYDGSFPGFPNLCGGCTCADAINVTRWTDAQKSDLRAYVNAQISAAKGNAVGYVFWTWKTETKLVEWDWQYLLSLKMVSVPPGN
ncbi:hypothetical protein HDU93_003206 [Gonapodya sp. JEL0774]|nr:hypothetical protein HDU93_003206 [Gonapodya sp. JEL0774]